jgi:hypothetical protein
MSKEIELGHLAVTDRRGRSSYVVLTNYRVYHQSEGGVFGSSTIFIPHKAITSVQIGWRRVWWILALGLILLGVSIFSFIQGLEPILQYGLLIGGLAMLLLFWFHKASDLQIISPTATIGGKPDKHDEGRRFCDLLLSAMEEEAIGNIEEAITATKKKTPETEWRL